jgi:hypothetical protein
MWMGGMGVGRGLTCLSYHETSLNLGVAEPPP